MNWKPIESAPKDGTHILAYYAPKSRIFEIWHKGETVSGSNMGWALYPGYGGVSDSDFAGWMPLPPPPENTHDA